MKFWKSKKESAPNDQHPPNYQQTRTTSVSVPLGYMVHVRKMWLGTMFFLGMFSQYLMAIYTPEVWNYVYGLIRNFMPS
ncbi:MAG: hypothetical protein G8D89_20880 [gamma proteobacterium symbiont of Clathrolucina costata]